MYMRLILTKIKLTITNNYFSFCSLIYPKHLNVFTIFFLRKNKTFIKSKYSRTRQWSKVIVYFGLWYGIISVFFLTAYCYRFLFIFSYLWWVIFIVIFLYLLKHFFKNFKFLSYNALFL